MSHQYISHDANCNKVLTWSLISAQSRDRQFWQTLQNQRTSFFRCFSSAWNRWWWWWEKKSRGAEISDMIINVICVFVCHVMPLYVMSLCGHYHCNSASIFKLFISWDKNSKELKNCIMTSWISLGILDSADTFQRMEIYVFSIALSSGLLCCHVAKDKMISHKSNSPNLQVCKCGCFNASLRT